MDQADAPGNGLTDARVSLTLSQQVARIHGRLLPCTQTVRWHIPYMNLVER